MKTIMKSRKLQVALAGILVFVLITGQSIPFMANAANSTKATQEDTNLLAHYDFEEEKDGKLLDVSGHGYDAAIKGNGATVSGGEIHFPGGAAGSNAAYVELPKGMFDNRNVVTISMWLKNETDKGNFSAMYIGTESTSHYWLMNPGNVTGTFKSVITKNTYTGEYGFSPTNGANGILGPASSGKYALYTTVIEEGKITVYYNGENCGTVNTGVSVSEFGENLSAYLAKSPYPDMFFKGGIRDLKIYTRALEEDEVVSEYYNNIGDASVARKALEEDKNTLVIREGEWTEDIELPERGGHKSIITWESSAPQYLAADGTVTRPTGATGDVKVTLTATLTLGSQTETKTFTVTILADTPENNFKVKVDAYELGQTVAIEDITLPTTLGDDISLTWTTSDVAVISADGKINRPKSGTGNSVATLTVTATCQGMTREKQFQVEVIEQPYGEILTYIRSGNDARSDALHYAYGDDEGSYIALNNNRPILYRNQLLDKKMGSPVLFRKADGTYGLIASDDNNSTEVVVYDSKDLTLFSNPRTLVLNQEGIAVRNPSCRYDSASCSYIISYEGSDGKSYEAATKDFVVADTPKLSDYRKETVEGTLPEGAMESGIFEVTKQEYETILTKWQRVINTSVTKPEDVTLELNSVFDTSVLPEKATANYSDGSEKSFHINWNQEDVTKVDTSKEGTYTINGTINQPEYSDVLVEQRADPWTFLGDDGYYYFTGSYPVCGTVEENQGIGYDRVVLRRSKTLQGLRDAEEVTIWHADDYALTYRYIWAPEIHQIDGKWYVFYTASIEQANPYNIRPHVLECTGDDPMDKDSWTIHRMEAMDGDTFAVQQFSLDMTHFESAGTHYVVWAANPGDFSNLYIATVDPEKPWKLTSECTKVTRPDFAWENPINEGPAVIKNNGMVYLCYSAAAVNYTYCVGMLSAKEGDNLLDADAWTKYPIPLLSTDDLVNQCGPGHNSFTTDENGNPVIVYHARPIHECSSGGDWDGTIGRCEYINPGENSLIDPCRHARVKSVNFAVDGTPILNMTPEEELNSAYKNVQITVTVMKKTVQKPEDNTNHNPSNGGNSQTETKKGVKEIKLDVQQYVYNKKVRTPKVTVYNTEGAVITADNYTVSYAKGRKQPGIYQVTVTMKGEYTGVYTKTFRILPKRMTLKKALKKDSRSIKLMWKKAADKISGYQIQYGTTAGFKKKTTKTKLFGKGKTSCVLKNLKPGKKYYIRIRSYKKVKENGKSVKIYSQWSKKKMVKLR